MKISFLTPLRVQKEPTGKWRLLEDFCFSVDSEFMCVPQDFMTDFASVPRLPFAYLLAGNTSHESAVIHDWLYSIGHDRARADEIFRVALAVEGVPGWRRHLMWVAVRVGGSFVFEKHKRRLTQ